MEKVCSATDPTHCVPKSREEAERLSARSWTWVSAASTSLRSAGVVAESLMAFDAEEADVDEASVREPVLDNPAAEGSMFLRVARRMTALVAPNTCEGVESNSCVTS